MLTARVKAYTSRSSAEERLRFRQRERGMGGARSAHIGPQPFQPGCSFEVDRIRTVYAYSTNCARRPPHVQPNAGGVSGVQPSSTYMSPMRRAFYPTTRGDIEHAILSPGRFREDIGIDPFTARSFSNQGGSIRVVQQPADGDIGADLKTWKAKEFAKIKLSDAAEIASANPIVQVGEVDPENMTRDMVLSEQKHKFKELYGVEEAAITPDFVVNYNEPRMKVVFANLRATCGKNRNRLRAKRLTYPLTSPNQVVQRNLEEAAEDNAIDDGFELVVDEIGQDEMRRQDNATCVRNAYTVYDVYGGLRLADTTALRISHRG